MGDCDADPQDALGIHPSFSTGGLGSSLNDNSSCGPRLVEADAPLIIFLPENMEG